MAEEFTHLRKSKPVILAAGVIWAMIAAVYASNGLNHAAEVAVRHNFLEYSELMLFLLVAMTYINSMDERQVFDALRSWLIRKGFSFRQLFWLTGILAFFISPVADNLTTALLMGAVVMAVADQRFGTHFVAEKRESSRATIGNRDKSNARFDLEALAEAQRLYVSKTMEAKQGEGLVFVNCMEKLTMNDPTGTLRARLRAAMDGGIDGITLSAGLHLKSLKMMEDHPRFRDVKLGIIVSSAIR